MESGPLNLPKNQQTLWATGSGPICVQTHQSVPPLLQLAARSICGGNRHIPPGLEDNQRLCQPTMESDPQCANENTNAGSRCNPGNSCLEDTAWYPLLLLLVVDWPRLLPKLTPNIVSVPIMPQLAMWSISGRALTVKAFRDKLQSLSSTLGDQKLADHMTHYSGDGIAGVLNGVQIPFQDL